ncbi:MAG: hypothetical protein ACMG6H_07865 [Acidobacteriota bacterium]
MKKRFFVTAIITAFLMLCSLEAKAQTPQPADLPKYEVGVDFSSFTFQYGETQPGLGGRLTYNLNRHLALEAAGYFFPGKCEFCGGRGSIAEGLFGVKAGHRFKKWGIFAKGRPGLVRLSKGAYDFVANPAVPAFPFTFVFRSQTNLAADLGGVLEFYPSKKIVLRFDVGDTIVRYGRRTFNSPFQDPTTGTFSLVPFTVPAYTQHNPQLIGGVGFRF